MDDVLFIKLTSDTGGELWVRIDTVMSIHNDGGMTEVTTWEKEWNVQETTDEVVQKFSQAAMPALWGTYGR